MAKSDVFDREKWHSIAAAQRWFVWLNPSLGDRQPVALILRRRTRARLDAIANERTGSFA